MLLCISCNYCENFSGLHNLHNSLHKQSLYSLLPAPDTTLLPVTTAFLSLECHTSNVIQCLAFFGWILSFNRMFLWFRCYIYIFIYTYICICIYVWHKLIQRDILSTVVLSKCALQMSQDKFKSLKFYPDPPHHGHHHQLHPQRYPSAENWIGNPYQIPSNKGCRIPNGILTGVFNSCTLRGLS